MLDVTYLLRMYCLLRELREAEQGAPGSYRMHEGQTSLDIPCFVSTSDLDTFSQSYRGVEIAVISSQGNETYLTPFEMPSRAFALPISDAQGMKFDSAVTSHGLVQGRAEYGVRRVLG